MHNIIQNHLSAAAEEGRMQIPVGAVFKALIEQLGKDEALGQIKSAMEFDPFITPPSLQELTIQAVEDILEDIEQGVDIEYLEGSFPLGAHTFGLYDQKDGQNNASSDLYGFNLPSFKW